MNPKAFNAKFRPLVNEAWGLYCSLTGCPVSDKTRRDAWYRKALDKAVHKDTTKGLTDKEQRDLLHAFEVLADHDHVDFPTLPLWSERQNAMFERLAEKAWRSAGKPGNLIEWVGQTAWPGRRPWQANDKTESFDRAMSELAIVAGDSYWIDRTTAAAENRLRYLIRCLLQDLDELQGGTHTWAYVAGIWKQSQQLPVDIDDAPAQTLFKVFQMLDTHVRRVADRQGMHPDDLDSRRKWSAPALPAACTDPAHLVPSPE